MVDILTTDPEIKGLNPAFAWHQDMKNYVSSYYSKNVQQLKYLITLINYAEYWASNKSIVVDHSTTNPEIKGSNPAFAWHQDTKTVFPVTLVRMFNY